MEKNINKGEQAFINALLSLMEEKPYNQISVSELSELAEYDRRTYYRYFTSKDDILFSHYAALLAEMATSMSATPLTPKSGFLSFFEFWNNHKDFLALLYKHNLIFFFWAKSWISSCTSRWDLRFMMICPKSLHRCPSSHVTPTTLRFK